MDRIPEFDSNDVWMCLQSLWDGQVVDGVIFTIQHNQEHVQILAEP